MRILNRLRYNRALECIRDWKAIRDFHRGSNQSDDSNSSWWNDGPQKIQLVREHRTQGSLWVGRCADSLKFDEWLKAHGKKGIQVSVGHDAPPAGERPNVAAFHYTISDGSNDVQTLIAASKIIRAIVKFIRDGTPVFVNCDMAASRSRSTCAAAIHVLDGIPWSETFRQEIRNRVYDDAFGGFDCLPNPVLWKQFGMVVDMMDFEDLAATATEEAL